MVDKVCIILILFLLFTDCLLLVGVRRRHKPRPDMMVPWLFLYSLIIPALPVISVIIAVITNTFIASICIIIPAPLYAYLWIALYSYW